MGQIWGFHDILVVLCGYSSLWWPFVEIGNIWVFWVLSGERVGVNVEGGAEAYLLYNPI